MQREHFAVIIWALLCHMEPEAIEAACDELLDMPISDLGEVQALIRLLREEAAR